VRFLTDTWRSLPEHRETGLTAGVGPDTLSLTGDLLGATLVDAQDELWDAWELLARAGSSDQARAGSSDQARAWLTEPPPWPPASVAKYLRQGGERAMSLMQTLAAEVAPEPAPRAWLVRSWLSPARTVDQTLLAELAQAAGGRLAEEPRFRAWLKEEWTAWSRQRYRRVARVVAARLSSRPK
jgi:hypothetical protein